jgi:hypothetical protein
MLACHAEQYLGATGQMLLPAKLLLLLPLLASICVRACSAYVFAKQVWIAERRLLGTIKRQVVEKATAAAADG